MDPVGLGPKLNQSVASYFSVLFNVRLQYLHKCSCTVRLLTFTQLIMLPAPCWWTKMRLHLQIASAVYSLLNAKIQLRQFENSHVRHFNMPFFNTKFLLKKMSLLLQVTQNKITSIKVMNRIEFHTNCVLSICGLLWAHLIGLSNNEAAMRRQLSWEENSFSNCKELLTVEAAFIIYIKGCTQSEERRWRAETYSWILLNITLL